MKNAIKLSVFAMMAALCFACQSEKESAFSDLKGLYEDVSANYKEYTEKDWEKFLDKFNEVESRISANEYTAEEMKEIAKMKGKCASYAVKASAETAGKQIKDAINEATDVLDGFMEGLGVKEEK